jgi:hypothetical protein
MIKILDNWSFTDTDPYFAPERQRIHVVGNLRQDYGENSHYDGRPFRQGDGIRTSAVVKTEGRKIFTVSGSCYQLGKIDPGYRKFLREQGIEYDPRNPVKTR